MYDSFEAYMKFENEYLKSVKEEYENKFNDYRDIDDEEMNNYINKKLGEIPLHKILQEKSLIDLIWDFDAVNLYASAISDEKSICPRIETGYGFTADMNDELVEKFQTQAFTQVTAILKIQYYNPKKIIV